MERVDYVIFLAALPSFAMALFFLIVYFMQG